MSVTPRSAGSGPLRGSVRRNLIAGLIVIAPVGATVFVLWYIFQLLDGLLGRFLYPALGDVVGRETFVVPGLGLLTLFLILVTVGWVAQRAVGGRVVAFQHAILQRLPLTGRIYGAANRIVRTVFGQEQARPFKKVVLVRYPTEGRYAVGFLSGTAPAAIRRHVPGAMSVLVPTSPNPTTGFLIVVAPEYITELDMSIDEAFTYVLSAGAVTPEQILG
jgi:uncharacterized membrane protein